MKIQLAYTAEVSDSYISRLIDSTEDAVSESDLQDVVAVDGAQPAIGLNLPGQYVRTLTDGTNYYAVFAVDAE